MVYEKVILLINEEKPNDEKQKLMQQVMPILGPHIGELILKQAPSEEKLKQVCQNYHDVDLFIVYGGDGTVHLVINEFGQMEDPPKLAILPGGTCNDFSRVLAIPQNLKKAAETILNNQSQPIDMASINDNYFLNFAGGGLIAETSENIDDQLKQSLGKVSYFLSAIQQFQQSNSMKFHVTVDDEVIEEEAVMVLVMNGYFVGTHQFPLPSISVQDGYFDVIFVKESNLQTIRDWFSLSNKSGRANEQGQIKHVQGKHIKIQTEDAKEIDTDGEIYLETPIDIKVMSKKLNMIVGEGFKEAGTKPSNIKNRGTPS
ncbi:YegS/Rv2252/BmrU family lipid kinase [Filobacillus milosensis]|uniref:YegS/Rv2252/BmrU family lipid kinase n=1 Tax=Filobacillus milosensis TaxID=94137 RepID=A0A4Y8IKM7_9BACI|nr:YegS/Rv2252/BmrU family lipid kinase [Filobacillus milosensis]TFB21696.1 YegS/Rv2252/BmrU family lipid kinase [Filobacillus milosensis]